MANDLLKVIAGVETHTDIHHVAIITEHGKHAADKEFLAVGSGYRKIFAFITEFGPVLVVEIEETGSYGAELSRVLTKEGLTIQEINRSNRQARTLARGLASGAQEDPWEMHTSEPMETGSRFRIQASPPIHESSPTLSFQGQ